MCIHILLLGVSVIADKRRVERTEIYRCVYFWIPKAAFAIFDVSAIVAEFWIKPNYGDDEFKALQFGFIWNSATMAETSKMAKKAFGIRK